MTLDAIKAHLPSEVAELLSAKQATEWADVLFNHNKKGEELSKLFQVLVEHSDWKRNRATYSLAKHTFSLLKIHKKELSEKAKSRFEKIKDVFKKQTAPQLFTTKLNKPKTCKTVKDVLEIWKKKAGKKEKKAKKLDLLPKEKKDLALDSSKVSKWLLYSFKNLKDTERPYIAYDQDDKIQGIAIATFSKQGTSELDFLSTHPENVVVFGTEKATRGAGTALIKHIASDLKKKHPGKNLSVKALASALPFYEKLGFVVIKSFTTFYNGTEYLMELPHTSIDALLAKNPDASVMVHAEPKAKRLKKKV